MVVVVVNAVKKEVVAVYGRVVVKTSSISSVLLLIIHRCVVSFL